MVVAFAIIYRSLIKKEVENEDGHSSKSGVKVV
jgi:hypothetical protein